MESAAIRSGNAGSPTLFRNCPRQAATIAILIRLLEMILWVIAILWVSWVFPPAGTVVFHRQTHVARVRTLIRARRRRSGEWTTAHRVELFAVGARPTPAYLDRQCLWQGGQALRKQMKS